MTLKKNPLFYLSKYIPYSPNTFEVSHTRLGLALASICLGQALQSGNGFINVAGIFFLTLSLIYLGYAIFKQPRIQYQHLTKVLFPILIIGLLLQIYQLATSLPGDSSLLFSQLDLWLFRFGVIISGSLALTSLVAKNWLSNLFVALVLLSFWFLGVFIIENSPAPFIDVFVFHQTSAKALLNGYNPYMLFAPNIFGHTNYYGSELVNGDLLTIGNPYPPLSIYMSTIGYILFNDIRYSHLFAIILSGGMMAFLHPSRETKLAAFIFLFTPRIFYVIEQSWTEPIVLLFLVGSVYIAIRRPRWLSFAFGLFFASKQYLIFIFPLVFLLIPFKSSWKKTIVSLTEIIGTSLVVTAPLALWNFSAFLWNVGIAQWYQVFRLDALSYFALYTLAFNQKPSQLISFIVLTISLFFIWRLIPRTPTGFAVATAWCLGIFFAFNKQAFCNYYFLVIGATCVAFVSLSTEQSISLSENQN